VRPDTLEKLPMAKSEVNDAVLREPAETRHADQLEALRQNDGETPPSAWRLSPRAVFNYIAGGKPLKAKIGGKAADVPITRKFFGEDTLVERAIVTLASERALLLIGEPGTGKSHLSEHLAAAISGNSCLTIQGTAGTTEEHIKYSWNIARVIAEGPRPENLIPAPTMVAMRSGALLRFEEITRCVPDVQDALVSILSDKAIAVPELPDHNMVWARPGFNVIATANTRDQGANDLSAALKRRFNYIYISTAEAIGTALDAVLHARFFGGKPAGAEHIARNLVGSIVKEDQGDLAILKEYVVLVGKKRAAGNKLWKEFHDALLAELR
jgi:energy-coupling factor transporter ATP-binding protein EcfA2